MMGRDPNFRTDRLVSAIARRRRSLRYRLLRDRDRALPVRRRTGARGRPTNILIDTGSDLFGGGARVEEFPVCDQYTLQGDAFSRAVLGQAPFEFPLEDAILSMRAIDALFRSAERGSWETP
jgi:predicted dehydrogenase